MVANLHCQLNQIYNPQKDRGPSLDCETVSAQWEADSRLRKMSPQFEPCPAEILISDILIPEL